MNFNRFFPIAPVAIVFLGLSGCNSIPDTTETRLEAQTRQQIDITGAATPYPAMERLAAAYEAQTQQMQVNFLPPNQSSGGILGVQEGMVDIGTVTRQPKPEENEPPLQYREIAKDALLVATHPSVEGVSDLSTEQLQAIYSGAATNWQEFGGPDAEIIVLDRAEDESAKRLLRQYYLGPELLSSPEAIVLRHEIDLVAAVQNTPYSIGAFSLAKAISEELPVNRLSLNGVEPTPENVRRGTYPMARTLGVVYAPNPSKPAQKFLQFSASQPASEVLLESGFVPSGG